MLDLKCRADTGGGKVKTRRGAKSASHVPFLRKLLEGVLYLNEEINLFKVKFGARHGNKTKLNEATKDKNHLERQREFPGKSPW